ncbi:hemerythrin domain-containing protein [Bacillus massilinigeriensis]|uniref:hemerythrin domain-containing protein n=1 Tax=Bacillus massilionigeriensis TaxID=1805475 RepID=UPI00096AEE6D|nr:hemerythrin domain-containing protein [Bacillus massilionigeriensis]
MTGPSLKKQEAHSTIHEAALNEARELNKLFRKCLEKREKERALQIAEIAIEHWESRTLKHAEAEEEGLYKDLVEERPELQKTIHQLTRDHDLMRVIVDHLKTSLHSQTPNDQMLTLLDTLIVIDEIHNEEEMNKLLANN